MDSTLLPNPFMFEYESYKQIRKILYVSSGSDLPIKGINQGLFEVSKMASGNIKLIMIKKWNCLFLK